VLIYLRAQVPYISSLLGNAMLSNVVSTK